MMIKYDGICLPNNFILDERVQKIVLEKFKGLLLRDPGGNDYNFYMKHKDKLIGMIDGVHPSWGKDIQIFLDEPSHNSWSNPILDSLIREYPNANIGDLNKSSLKEYYKKYPKVGLSYTAFRNMWFNFFDLGIDLRIPAWFGLFRSNQIKFWEWMQKEFGDRFNICWINLTTNDDCIPKLRQWAELHNKEQWLYVESGITIEEFLIKILN